jgi:hypothetical protein
MKTALAYLSELTIEDSAALITLPPSPVLAPSHNGLVEWKKRLKILSSGGRVVKMMILTDAGTPRVQIGSLRSTNSGYIVDDGVDCVWFAANFLFGSLRLSDTTFPSAGKNKSSPH